MTRLRQRLAVLSVAVLLGAVATPASAAADDTVLDGVRLFDAGPGLTGNYRYTVLVLELDLSDPDELPDTLSNWELEPYPVALGEVDRSGAAPSPPWEILPRYVPWETMTRVAGTSAAGTWRGTVAVSSVSTGRVVLDSVSVTDREYNVTGLEFPSLLTLDLPTTAESAPWVYEPLAVVKVVTGRETWRPSVRLTTRSGAPVAGAMTYAEGPPFQDRVSQTEKQLYPAGSPPPTADFPLLTDGAGVVTLPGTYAVWRRPLTASLGGYGRGTSRYHAMMARGVPLPIVKWQAGASFTAAPGDVVTMTGNAFPAPVLFVAANPTVHLQRLVGRTWRTEASGTVRANGRFTVVWDAPDAAGYWVRAYKPGGTDANGQSAGTVGPHVWVATP